MCSIVITQRGKNNGAKTKHKNQVFQGSVRSLKVIQTLMQSSIFNYLQNDHLQGDHFYPKYPNFWQEAVGVSAWRRSRNVTSWSSWGSARTLASAVQSCLSARPRPAKTSYYMAHFVSCCHQGLKTSLPGTETSAPTPPAWPCGPLAAARASVAAGVLGIPSARCPEGSIFFAEQKDVQTQKEPQAL